MDGGKKIIYRLLHCHHDSRLQMGSDESHFNIA